MLPLQRHIECYGPEDVSVMEEDKCPLKLGNIEASVKKATHALDAVMSDSKKAGIDTSKPNQKFDLIHSMEKNAGNIRLKFSMQMDAKRNGPWLSHAQRQLIYQYRNEEAEKRMKNDEKCKVTLRKG